MRFIDPAFLAHPWRYAGQCALATGALLAVLAVLDAASDAVVIAALGSSSFIAFTMPHREVSRPRFLLGGYAVGLAVGSLCFRLSREAQGAGWPVVSDVALVLFAALAVGLAIFIMCVTNTEHPPAAGVALALALGPWHLGSVAVTAAAIVALVVGKRLLKPFLINLL